MSKRSITICDCCGKEYEEPKLYSHFHGSSLKFSFNIWGGGSMGGDEDTNKWTADLCEDCGRKLANFIFGEMKMQPDGKNYYPNHKF